MPLGLVLDVEQEAHADLEEPRGEIGQLAHHARRLVTRLCERDEELRGELARVTHQVLHLHDSQHCAHHGHELLAQEARLVLPNVNEHLQRGLGVVLVARVQCLLQAAQHMRNKVLKLVPVGRRLQLPDEVRAGA